MSICLAGSHRSGKSTLAKLVADQLGWTYIPSRAGEVFASFDLDMSEEIAADVRLEIQIAILDAHANDLSAQAGRPWICDRSALDSAAYMTLNMVKDCPARLARRGMEYIDRCFQVANRHCAAIVLVQPGIPYVAAPNKPPPNDLLVEAMNTYVWGLMNDRRMTAKPAFIRRDVTDLDVRAAHLRGLIGKLHIMGQGMIPEGLRVC